MFLKSFQQLGEKQLMWLNKLKIAIIEKNVKSLNKLLDDIPQLENPNEIEEAIYLLREASELLHSLKDDTQGAMIQMKKNIDFMKSTQEQPAAKLDITS